MLVCAPVVLIFYRGAWYPYCDMQLHALKESLPYFQRYDAQLVAVTPQTPDRCAKQIAKDAYPFPILSDLDDKVMKAYNLHFEVPNALRDLYIQGFKLDLADYKPPPNGAGGSTGCCIATPDRRSADVTQYYTA